MARLARNDTALGRNLWARLTGAWGASLARDRITIKVNSDELTLLCRLELPVRHVELDRVVKSGWVVTYQHPKKRNLCVTVYTRSRPKRKRIFKFRGGQYRTEAVKVVNLNKQNKEEAAKMAAKTKKKTSKKVKEEELEELEGLEELEDLEDLDDEDLEDEEDEDVEDDEEDEDEEDDEDEDEDEDEEDEEEEPAPKKSKSTKSSKSAKAKSSTKTKSGSRAKAPAKAKGKKAKGSPRQALPEGRLSPADVAALSKGKLDARAIRVYLRDHEDKWPKGDQFRYSFTKKQGERLVNEILKKRRSKKEEE